MSIKGIAWLVLVLVLVKMSFGETATSDLEKADLLYEAGQYNQAQDLYRKVVSESKDYSDVRHGLFQLGQCLTAQGKYVEAIEVFDGLMNKYPNSKEAESALYRKGCILAGFMKDVQRGLERFDELLRRFPGEYGDDALYSIGSIYFARKDYTKAQEAYKKFLSMYPASPYSKVVKENLSELEKSKGRGLVLSGKPVELEFQGNTYTITKNDSQPVGVATGDGSIYRFQANLSGAWKTNLHTHGIWMASPDGKELVWLSDQSGVTPLVEPPCPSGGGGGGPCPCQLPDCVGTISITASPDKVCVNGPEPSYNVVITGNYTQCAPQPSIDTSTTGVKTATAYACCTDCTGAHTISAVSNPVTVYKVASVTLDPGSMSSGGKGSDVHKASVTATTSPAASGVNISFNIKEGTGQGKNVPATLSPSSGTTGADGKVTLNLALKSSDKVETATIVAGCDTQTDKAEANASFGKPNDTWDGRYPSGSGNFGSIVPNICVAQSEDLRLKLTFPWRAESQKPVDSHNILFDFLSILDENNVAVLRTAYSQYATLSPTTGITDTSGFVTTTLNGIKACTTQVYAVDSDVYTSQTDKATYSTIQIAAIDAEITKCLNSWLPKGGSEDNTTTFTATIYPNTVLGTIKFTLYDVSDEKGYCLNAPNPAPGSGEDSDTFKDLQFPTQTGFTVSGTNSEVATTSSNVNSATVIVKSFDYGSYGKIKAEATVDGITCIATVVGGTDNFAMIPLDDNTNNIADSWSGNDGNATDDNDNSPTGNGTSGDRLTRYEEYRGFMVNGTHISTDPTKKDVFYNDNGSIGHQSDWTENNLGAPIRKVSNTEIDANRGITFNSQTSVGSGQRAIKQLKDIPVLERNYFWGESVINIPFNVNKCAVYTDNQEFGIQSGTTLSQAISATDTTIKLKKQDQDPLWESSGKFKIEQEIIAYSSVTLQGQNYVFTNVTRGSDGTTAAAHANNTFVGYFVNPDDLITHVVAHESGHAVNINHDTQRSQMFAPTKAGDIKGASDHQFRHTGTVTGSTQEFAVK